MSKNHTKPKIIFVLGMHRSGTSLVAQSVAEWSAYMGNDLLPPDENNPDGYWEHNPLVTFHDKILLENGTTWYTPPMHLQTDSLIRQYGEEARKLVAEMDLHGSVWCWKDPRTALFLEFWKAVLDDRELLFIIVHRDLTKMITSLKNRDAIHEASAISLWEYYSMRIFHAVAGIRNFLIINYDRLVSHPEQEGSELYNFLDKAAPGTRDPLKNAPWERIVNKNLNRSQPASNVLLTPLQQELLDMYEKKVIPADYTPSAEALVRLQSLFILLRNHDFQSQPSHFLQPATYAQLFYLNENNHFSEQDSFKRINPGTKERFTFDLAGVIHPGYFRFDPLNDFTYLKVHEISYLKENKKIEIPVQITSNAVRQTDNLFLFDTNDPQIYIKTGGDESFRPDAMIIEIEYIETGAPVVDQLKGFFSNQYTAQISDQQTTISALRESNATLLESNAALKETIIKSEAIVGQAIKNQEELNKKLIDIQNSASYRISMFYTSVKRWVMVFRSLGKLRSEIVTQKEIWQIKNSGLFDEKYYLFHNPDIICSKLGAARHYLVYGASEGRNPSDFFDNADYLLHNPDVAGMNMNPLLHFLRFGIREEREGGLSPNFIWHNHRKERNMINLVFRRGLKIVRHFSENPEFKLVRESRFFDADYYKRVNSDVQASGMAPEAHFCLYGWKEGRNPGPLFDTAYYLDANMDVRTQKVNPLIHYIQFGEKEKRLPKPFEYDENQCKEEADIREIDLSGHIADPGKIAVACHLFHLDLADELTGYFRQIPYPYDLFITTPSKDVQFLKEYFSRELPDVNTTILPVENMGRDVAPFINLLAGHLMNYDLVCKIHSKKSGHDTNLEVWRRFMLDQLLGNLLIVSQVASEFKNDPRLGMIWPLPYPYLKQLGVDRGWGPPLSREANHRAALTYFKDMEVPALDENFPFPAGNMFWFRPEALKYLTEKHFTRSDYGEENNQIDGTLAHAVERLTGFIAGRAGYIHKTIFFSSAVVNAYRNNRPDFPPGSKKILFIAHDLFRAGAEMVLLHLLNWLNRHTLHELIVLVLKKGADGGKLLSDYQHAARLYLLEDLLAGYNQQEAIALLMKKIGNVDLIYGNTIVVANIYPLLERFNAPVITHIHELEESIRRYTTPEIRTNMKNATTAYIPCSAPVQSNLISSHGIDPRKLFRVDEFISVDQHPLPDRSLQRQITSMPADKVIIWGCGTIYWRKGTDLFIETAGILKQRGIENFLFCWIGTNLWDIEAGEWGTWHRQEERIAELSLEGYILFIGEKERPGEYFKAGDIYFLSSREDPYPLVCLEAAECGLPLVCFAEAGGIPDFVGDDAGEVVPLADLDKAAGAIAALIADPEMRMDKGTRAREKLLQRHTDDIAVPAILELCRNTMNVPPVVSIIVPVYNHAPFLRDRLESILKQYFRDVEIILLDDASTDDSVKVAGEFLAYPSCRLIRNETNSGSPFRQWEKGIAAARGLLVWIAEGDDLSEADFLTRLIPAFNNPEIVMAYCGSHNIDSKGTIHRQHYIRAGHYDGLGYPRDRWSSDFIADGIDEVTHTLAIRNTIPNVSAVLFRRSVFSHVNFSDAFDFATAGDWRIYVSVLKHGSLAYFHQHLNHHRIHADSVVGSNKKEARLTLPDYFRMHRFILQEFNIPQPVRELMISSVTDNLRRLWPELTNDEFCQLYDVSTLKQ